MANANSPAVIPRARRIASIPRRRSILFTIPFLKWRFYAVVALKQRKAKPKAQP